MNYLRKRGRSICRNVLLLAVVLFVFVGNPLKARAYIQTQGTVISDSAVIRKTPDTTSNAIASVVKGDKVTINNEEKDANGVIWYKVFVDANTLGYVRGDLIQKDGTTGTAQNTSADTNASNTNTSDTNTAGTTDANNAAGTDTNAGNDANAGADTALVVGGQTVVTPIQSQGASVTSDNVRVRAEASASAGIVTQVKSATAITVTGQATGDDGKTWYQVSFIADGKEVTGFIRSDFVNLTEEIVVISEESSDPAEPQQPEEVQPEENQVPVNNDYELRYEPDAEGINDWYLYNNVDGVKNRLSEILEAADGNGESVQNAEQQLKKEKMVIIVLAIVLVFMALAITLLLFKLRDAYYDDFDEYDEDPEDLEEPERPARAPRTVRPVQGERPAARPGGSQGQRPVRPVNDAARPQGQRPVRPANGPAQSQGQRPVRPANGTPQPQGQRPTRPANGTPQPQGQRPTRPANGTPQPQGQRPMRPANDAAQPQKQDGGWKPKNFMAEDDDLEFEFLNWNGEDQ